MPNTFGSSKNTVGMKPTPTKNKSRRAIFSPLPAAANASSLALHTATFINLAAAG